MGVVRTHIFEVVKCISKFNELIDTLESTYKVTQEDCYKYSIYQEALFVLKHEYTANLMLTVLKAENEDKAGLSKLINDFLSGANVAKKFYRETNDVKGNMEYAYVLSELSCYLDYLDSGVYDGPVMDLSTLNILHKVKGKYQVDDTDIFATKMQIPSSNKDLSMVEGLSKMNSKFLALELVAIYKLLGDNPEEDICDEDTDKAGEQ